MATVDYYQPRVQNTCLHRSTWAMLLLASVLIFLVVIPGEYVDYAPAGEVSGIAPLTFEHGWPWPYLRRGVEPPSTAPLISLPHHGVPWLQKWAWSLDGDTLHWSPWLLLVDMLTVAGLLAMVATVEEWRLRRRQFWQTSIAELLMLTLLFCVALGWWMANVRNSQKERQALAHYSSVSFGFDYSGPLWLRRTVGIDHLQPFHRVATLNLRPSNDLNLGTASAEFPHVQNMNVRSQISDADLSHIARLPRLQTLKVKNVTSITDDGIRHLRNSRRLQRLVIEECPNVTGVGLGNLAELRWLYHVRLFGCDLSKRGAKQLGRLTRLEILDLHSSRVDDEHVSELGKLNLRQLGLAETEIDGSGLASLEALKQLEALNLNGTLVNDGNLDQLKKFQNLQRLDIVDTRISESGAAELRKRLPKCWIITR